MFIWPASVDPAAQVVVLAADQETDFPRTHDLRRQPRRSAAQIFLLFSKGSHWIHFRGAASGNIGSEDGGGAQNRSGQRQSRLKCVEGSLRAAFLDERRNQQHPEGRSRRPEGVG